MLHDTLKAALVIAVMAAACSLLVETRHRLATIELASRLTIGHPQPQHYAAQPQPEHGPLRRFGREALDLADAALGIVR